MKVYAHYHEEDKSNGNAYRWRTLLQFGDSWSVIGSVVMKNPGSATPIDKDNPISDNNILSHLHEFDKENEWYLFRPDNTMQNIERLFRCYQIENGGSNALNGIIQIFNLINVRDPNLNNALKKNANAKYDYANTVDEDIELLVAPVYLGWGSLGFEETFRQNAQKIFDATKNTLNGKYLHPNFLDNKFYHPQYLMGRGKNKPNSQFLLNSFCQNTEHPVYIQIAAPAPKVAKEVVSGK